MADIADMYNKLICVYTATKKQTWPKFIHDFADMSENVSLIKKLCGYSTENIPIVHLGEEEICVNFVAKYYTSLDETLDIANPSTWDLISK